MADNNTAIKRFDVCNYIRESSVTIDGFAITKGSLGIVTRLRLYVRVRIIPKRV